MNNNFLILHSNEDNSVLILRADNIIIIYSDTDEYNNKITKIELNSEEIETVIVNETPEKIYSMLPNKFLKLHDATNNNVININIDYIIYAGITEDNTEIYFTTDYIDNINVHESPEKIYGMISNLNIS